MVDVHRAREMARQARALTAHIESQFLIMPWQREFLLNPRQSYWNILSFLYVHQDEFPTKAECVRKFSYVSANTANHQLDMLLKTGIVQARPHPYDRRAKALSLTERTMKEMDRFFSSFEVEFRGPVSAVWRL